MSLNQLPESSQKSSSRFFLPAAVLTAISVALSACNKSETPASDEKAPIALPTGTMDDTIPTDSTQESRQAALGQVIRYFLEAQDAWKSIGAFTQDPTKPHNWRLASLSIGFGPQQKGTHMMTIKKQWDEVSVYDIVDGDSDGNPDFVEHSVSSPILAADGTRMIHSDKSYVSETTSLLVDPATIDMYAAGLDQAVKIFEAEKQLPQQGNK